MVFFAYIGFDAVSTAAQEARNPQRDLPIGILVLARRLHGALHRRVAHPDGRGPLHEAQRPSPDRGGRRGHGPAMARDRRRDRRHRGPVVRHARHAPRAAAHLLRDGARRPLPAGRRQDSPALRDALRHDHHDGRPLRRRRRCPAHRHPRRADEHRDAVRVRPREPRRHDPAAEAAGHPPRVQGCPGAPYVVPILGVASPSA